MSTIVDFQTLLTALGLVQTTKAVEEAMDDHDGHDHRRRKRALPDFLTGNDSYVRERYLVERNIQKSIPSSND